MFFREIWSSEHGHGDANSGMRQIEQEVSTINKVDVAVVAIRPSVGPHVDDFKVVSAIPEVRPAPDNGNTPDGEVVLAAEMSAKMGIVDAADFPLTMLGFAVFGLLMFFVAGFVVMFLLGDSGHRASEKERAAETAHYKKSIHGVSPLWFRDWTEKTRARAPLTHLHAFLQINCLML
jgi:hypothetical protein